MLKEDDVYETTYYAYEDDSETPSFELTKEELVNQKYDRIRVESSVKNSTQYEGFRWKLKRTRKKIDVSGYKGDPRPVLQPEVSEQYKQQIVKVGSDPQASARERLFEKQFIKDFTVFVNKQIKKSTTSARITTNDNMIVTSRGEKLLILHPSKVVTTNQKMFSCQFDTNLHCKTYFNKFQKLFDLFIIQNKSSGFDGKKIILTKYVKR